MADDMDDDIEDLLEAPYKNGGANHHPTAAAEPPTTSTAENGGADDDDDEEFVKGEESSVSDAFVAFFATKSDDESTAKMIFLQNQFSRCR